MNPIFTRFAAVGCAVAALVFFSGCCSMTAKRTGCLRTPYQYKEMRYASRGMGQINVKFDTREDEVCPTWYRLGSEDQPARDWLKVVPAHSSNPLPKRAQTYVIEFKNSSRTAPEARTVTIPEKQRLSLRVSYSHRHGRGCQ